MSENFFCIWTFLMMVMFVLGIFSAVKEASVLETKKKNGKQPVLQSCIANVIAAMLVFNREMTAAKRKLVDNVINNPKIAGNISSADFWSMIEKKMVEPDNLSVSLSAIADNCALDERMKIVHLLFKLSIEDDGIMNDEWDLLKKVVSNLKFSKQYTDHLYKFYGPLRSFSDTAVYNKLHGHLQQRKKEEQAKTKQDNAKSSSARSRKGQSGGGYSAGASSSRRTSSSQQGSASQQTAVNPLAVHYAVLGLKPTATANEVHAAYCSLAKQHHPDLPKNADRQEVCVALMAKINSAYDAIAAALN